jgi:hypothetical protein
MHDVTKYYMGRRSFKVQVRSVDFNVTEYEIFIAMVSDFIFALLEITTCQDLLSHQRRISLNSEKTIKYSPFL